TGGSPNATEIREYGFGAGAPGALVRKAHIDYLHPNPNTSNQDYTGTSIHNISKILRKTVYDGSSPTALAQTDYSYDGTVTTASGATQHDGGFRPPISH